jgi:hypothetical protein
MNNNLRDFANALKTIDEPITKSSIESSLFEIIDKLDDEQKQELLDISEKVASTTESKEGGLKKSIKELVGEIFPSLSFYPALGIWGLMDKAIKSDEGFNVLSSSDKRQLLVYSALFFGLVGSKIAYNRIKEKINNSKVDSQINEVLYIAGI